MAVVIVKWTVIAVNNPATITNIDSLSLDSHLAWEAIESDAMLCYVHGMVRAV